jgi:hypothetical protein
VEIGIPEDLVAMIKAAFGTQIALVKHIKEEHDSRPPLTKQQLSKRLKKLVPDWPLAVTIIECCSHGDEPAQASRTVHLAGIYQAATGQDPKGFTGPIKPASAPAAAPGSVQMPATAELRQLRRSLAEAQSLLGERDQLQREQPSLTRGPRTAPGAPPPQHQPPHRGPGPTKRRSRLLATWRSPPVEGGC